MRLILFLFLILCLQRNYANELILERSNISPLQTKTLWIPYVQLAYGVLPGVGCSFRVQKGPLGMQLDANAGTIAIGGVNEVSASLIFYPWAKQKHVWMGKLNIGVGAGMSYWYTLSSGDASPVFPFLLGYQGEKIFFGLVIHPLDHPESWLDDTWQKWVPSVKYGWCF